MNEPLRGAELRLAHLHALSRERALTDEESLTLERLLAKHDVPMIAPSAVAVIETRPPAASRAEPTIHIASEIQLAMFEGPLFDWIHPQELAA